jgi:hypothetical protein
MSAYYNEHNEYAAAWLRNLIAAGHIAPGDVDERSIVDVQSTDLRGYTQIHLFAGVGAWSLALRRAGWPDSRRIFTGSAPCQPFSSAGKGHGTADERHLWPEMFRLIAECRPRHIIGEQVASPAAMAWFDGVCADLEGIDYAVGAIVLASAGAGAGGEQSPVIGRLIQMARMAVRFARTDDERAHFDAVADWLGGLVDGGDHIRQRLYWCADAAFGLADGSIATGERRTRGLLAAQAGEHRPRQHDGRVPVGPSDASEGVDADDGMANGELLRTGPGLVNVEGGPWGGRDRPANDGAIGRLPDSAGVRRREEPAVVGRSDEGHPPQGWAPGFELGGMATRGLLDADGPGSFEGRQPTEAARHGRAVESAGGDAVALGDGIQPRSQGQPGHGDDGNEPGRLDAGSAGPVAPAGELDFRIVHCLDGKARRISALAGDEPLAHAIPRDVGSLLARLRGMGHDTAAARRIIRYARSNRVGRLHGYGNAIDPVVATEFVRAYMETIE